MVKREVQVAPSHWRAVAADLLVAPTISLASPPSHLHIAAQREHGLKVLRLLWLLATWTVNRGGDLDKNMMVASVVSPSLLYALRCTTSDILPHGHKLLLQHFYWVSLVSYYGP